MNRNHKVRSYVNGVRQKDIYQYKTTWQVLKYKVRMFFKKVLILGMCAVVLVIAFKAGAYFNPVTEYTQVEEGTPAVLNRIAGCESAGSANSKGTHYAKNGQVLLSPNKNGSVDVGRNQINDDVWGKKATELGYNLMVEKDNDAMAKWIYENRGTEDWYSSKKCWMK